MDDFTDRSQFRIGDLLVIPGRLIVLRDGQKIKFEPRWMEVLVMLAEHVGETLSTERLLIEVWGSTVYGDSPVSKTISYIRKSISDDSRKPRYVETVSKVGYRLIAPVSLPEDYRRMPSERWTKGSPYVGLSAFGADHASVFCGRSRIVADLLRAMRVQIENQRRFVLIVGASGCGKTSLLRAGAIPLLTKPDGFDGLRAVSVTTCDLAANGSDPLIPLTAALAAWTLGTRPVFPPQTPEQLKALLTDTPNLIESFVNEAFRRHSERDLAEQPYTHLLLTVDHAEALVATTDVDADARDAFARVLQALCACPHVMVTMIARGDFYLKLIEALPALAELKAGDGHLDVMAPRYGEIGEIIRSPAWKADLSFETDPETRTRLDDALRDAALSQPDALPLLQHTLQILYERRNSQQQLTFAAYNDIGGLEGAIAHRAEQVFAALPLPVQASLDIVLSKLIVIQPDSDAVSARRIDTTALDAHAKNLIDAFIRSRLFVGNHHNRHPTVGVVHEALLRQWPRAVEWAHDNQRLLQAKTRLQRAAARWADEGRQDDQLLNPGRPLSEALEVAKALPADLAENEWLFLQSSEKLHRRKKFLRNSAISMLITLAIASTAMAGALFNALGQSRANQRQAQDFADVMFKVANDLQKTGETKALASISESTLTSLEKSTKGKRTAYDLINESRALALKGNVMLARGNEQEAYAAFNSAYSIANNALRQSPEMNQAHEQFGQAAFWMGKYFYGRRQSGAAEPYWAKYREQYDKLLKKDQNNAELIIELSFALDNLGTLSQSRGDHITTATHISKSVELKERAISIDSKNQDWIYESIVSRSKLGNVQVAIGEFSQAQKTYSAAIDELEKLVDDNTSAYDWKRQLASLYQFKCRLSITQGNLDSARKEIRTAIGFLSEITAAAPDRNDWRQMLARAHYDAAEVARMEHDPMIHSHLLEAEKIISALSIDGKPPMALRHTQAGILVAQALSRKDVNKTDLLNRAISNLESLNEEQSKEIHVASMLVFSLVARSKHMLKNGEKQKALSDLEKARSMLYTATGKNEDPRLIGPRNYIDNILGLGKNNKTEKLWLKGIGYSHPDFTLPPQPAHEIRFQTN